MSNQPKLHAYAVACAFGTPEATDPPPRLIISVWIAYRAEEAAAMAMDQTHRAIAAQGHALAPHAGTTTFEITEDHLSHMLNALRTGGKGATVLQAVPPEQKCDHKWITDLAASDPLSGNMKCAQCGQTKRMNWTQAGWSDPA